MKTNDKAQVFTRGQVWSTGNGKVMVIAADHSLELVYGANVSPNSLSNTVFEDPNGSVLGIDASFFALSEGDLDAYQYTVSPQTFDSFRTQMGRILGAIGIGWDDDSDEEPQAVASGSDVVHYTGPEPMFPQASKMPERKPGAVASEGKLLKPELTIPNADDFVYDDGTRITFDGLRDKAITVGTVLTTDEIRYLATTYLGHKPFQPPQSESGRRRWDMASAADFMRLYNIFGSKVAAPLYEYDIHSVGSAYNKLAETQVGRKVAEMYPDVLA